MKTPSAELREGGLRQTVRLLREAATPEVYLRAFKSFKQSSRPATAVGTAAHFGAGTSPSWSFLIGFGNALWYALESFWDNTVSNAELALKDSPTKKQGMDLPDVSAAAKGEAPGPEPNPEPNPAAGLFPADVKTK